MDLSDTIVASLLEDDSSNAKSDMLVAFELPYITSTFLLMFASAEPVRGDNGVVWTFEEDGEDSGSPVPQQIARFLTRQGVNGVSFVEDPETKRRKTVYAAREDEEVPAPPMMELIQQVLDGGEDDGRLQTFYEVHNLDDHDANVLYSQLKSEGRI